MSKAIEVAARGGLPSLEKARAALVQCRTMAEVDKIKALAMAVASCAAAESTRTEAAGIVLECKARMGEITAEVKEGAPRGGRPDRGKSNCSRTEQLEAEGVSRKSAAENEKLAKLKADGTLARLIAKGETTTKAALAVYALKPPATGDAILFLWATSPKLAEAMRVVADWGFVYRTCMVWDKLVIGMGYYARQRHELLLIATRGAPPAPAPGDRPDSVISIKRGEHSAKPTRFYEIIEAMYPELPKIELFARTPRDGWSRWGNQSCPVPVPVLFAAIGGCLRATS